MAIAMLITRTLGLAARATRLAPAAPQHNLDTIAGQDKAEKLKNVSV
jgi:hypothetical protein